MNASVMEPTVVRATAGRIRFHLPAGVGHDQGGLEDRVRSLAGVRSAEANALTGNLLVQYDPDRTNQAAIIAAVRQNEASSQAAPAPPSPPSRPAAEVHRHGAAGRARIAVPGIDRDPAFARRVVAHLERRPGVRARANPLTSRVLIEYSAHHVDLEDLLSDIARVELPPLPDEDMPAHPLDRAPLVQSASRLVGSGLGLAVLAAQRLTGSGGSASAATAAQAAGVVGILQGFPGVREGLRRLMGRDTADLALGAAGIGTLALAGSPLGLALNAAESLRLVTEVLARRAAWRRYVERLDDSGEAEAGTVIRIDGGDRTPHAATIVEGTGTAVDRDGQLVPLAPGAELLAGARLFGGPFVIELRSGPAFEPQARATPPKQSLHDTYLNALGPVSLAYAAATAIVTRSPGRTFQSLLLVNPRTAIIGHDAAGTAASARVLRAGVTVVGLRSHRGIRRPDAVILGGARVLTDGFELTSVLPLIEDGDPTELLARAAGIAAAAGSPWGGAFRTSRAAPAVDGSFDGRTAKATVAGRRWMLGSTAREDDIPALNRLRRRGDHPLVLRDEREGVPLALIVLRPRLATGAAELMQTCAKHNVAIEVLRGNDSDGLRGIVRRSKVPLASTGDGGAVIRARQDRGERVAFVADSAHAAAQFAASDLAIALTTGHGHFPARADLLAPDLAAVAAIIEAGARRDASVRDSIALSIGANVFGAAWGFRGAPGVERASVGVYVSALAAMADGWARLRGGEQPSSTAQRLADPRPERWGQRGTAETIHAFNSTPDGLTTEQAVARQRQAPAPPKQHPLMLSIRDQLSSPLTGMLLIGAGVSLALGSVVDVLLIGASIAANVAIGSWQERRAGQAAETVASLGAATARVLRDGQTVTVASSDLVPGDVLMLGTGDRVPADARVLFASNLEVDEASLTGESLPSSKMAIGGTDAHRVILEGSDVVSGSGRAMVVAIGRHTRMGATAAALAMDETKQSPLGVRLSQMLRKLLPVAAGGGALVIISGLLRGRPMNAQLAIGASLALAAVPEGLPLLAGVGQGAIALRLAKQGALVRRVAAVEALGRVDVACSDKTGTLTEGRLRVGLVADLDHEAPLSETLDHRLKAVLLKAALASPHPDAPDAHAHPTDAAVVLGAQACGLGEELRAERGAEAPFDPIRAFHATVANGHLCVKGAPEALASRCGWARRGDLTVALDAVSRHALLDQAHQLAARGLRVLMVAEGSVDAPVERPSDLVALGFVGIRDPLRPTVPAAVRRCREAGVRVIMITGDHPATARAIAKEAGLLIAGDDDEIVTGGELAELDNGELDRRLAHATVIARATPLDKLAIIQSLQRQGHTVAMTGDGVNDAPALRLADVGVAMGRAGTEVARQAADVVLADDDFATLVEMLVEGRGFWQNTRRALGLLLGGNLGEVGLVVGASVLGLASPLTARQILAVNLVTDALPGLAVALQRPAHRNLAGLAREGAAAIDVALRTDVLRRATATAIPSLAAYIVTLGTGGLLQARTVAFASVVGTQLAQTLDAGWSEGSLSPSVLAAVAASAAVLIAAIVMPPFPALLGFAMPTPIGWGLIAGGALIAPILGRGLAHTGLFTMPAAPTLAPAAA